MGNKAAFFEQAHEREFIYFGYPDLQLRTERISEVDAREVDIRSPISRHYDLRNPIIGSCMNSISETKMAIAMGKVGAGSIIHHANTPDEQLEMIKDVYHYLNGIIPKPFEAKEEETVAGVLGRLDEKDKRFRTLPVTDNEGRCVGLMDEVCFRLFDSQTLVKDAMRPMGDFAVAAADTEANEAYIKMRDGRLNVLVLLDNARRVGGLCLAKDIGRMVRSDPNRYSIVTKGPRRGKLITMASVPTTPEEAIERVRLMKKYLCIVFIDTSHGEHRYAVDTLRALKEHFSYEADGIDIVAGNISTKQAAIEIAKLEPDAVQVGQGPGQICISSDRLGFGTPQASAVYEVSTEAKLIDPEIPIIADGGIADSADTVKAFALGASAVKVGGLIAGTDETPVPVKRDEKGIPYKEYWGMGSKRAQEAFAAARARYGHFGPPRKLIFVEGFEKKVPLKGPVADVIEEHVLGVKISMAAQGAPDISDIQEHASFMRGSNKKS